MGVTINLQQSGLSPEIRGRMSLVRHFSWWSGLPIFPFSGYTPAGLHRPRGVEVALKGRGHVARCNPDSLNSATIHQCRHAPQAPSPSPAAPVPAWVQPAECSDKMRHVPGGRAVDRQSALGRCLLLWGLWRPRGPLGPADSEARWRLDSSAFSSFI